MTVKVRCSQRLLRAIFIERRDRGGNLRTRRSTVTLLLTTLTTVVTLLLTIDKHRLDPEVTSEHHNHLIDVDKEKTAFAIVAFHLISNIAQILHNRHITLRCQVSVHSRATEWFN